MEERHREHFNKYFRYKKTVSILIVLILLGITLLLFAKVLGEFKSNRFIGQSMDVRSTITVSGVGEMTVIPDVGEFSFAVVQEAQETADAQNKVSEAMDNLLKYLEEFGVKEKDIKTTSYNISPRYEYTNNNEFRFPSGARELVGYEVSQWVTVKVRALDILGSVIGEIGSRGATNISNVRFTVEDEEVVKAEAREIAIADARAKAKILAKDLGVSLVRIVSFSEGGGGIYRNFAVTEARIGISGDTGISLPQIPVGENEIISNVTITYSVE